MLVREVWGGIRSEARVWGKQVGGIVRGLRVARVGGLRGRRVAAVRAWRGVAAMTRLGAYERSFTDACLRVVAAELRLEGALEAVQAARGELDAAQVGRAEAHAAYAQAVKVRA